MYALLHSITCYPFMIGETKDTYAYSLYSILSFILSFFGALGASYFFFYANLNLQNDWYAYLDISELYVLLLRVLFLVLFFFFFLFFSRKVSLSDMAWFGFLKEKLRGEKSVRFKMIAVFVLSSYFYLMTPVIVEKMFSGNGLYSAIGFVLVFLFCAFLHYVTLDAGVQPYAGYGILGLLLLNGIVPSIGGEIQTLFGASLYLFTVLFFAGWFLSMMGHIMLVSLTILNRIKRS